MTEHPVLVIPREYGHVEARVLALLREAGFRVHRTFCLSEARAAGGTCSCPYHGCMACTCEWCTYLVYNKKGLLVATLTLYGHDEHTRMTWKGDAERLPELDTILAAIRAPMDAKHAR